MKKQLVKVTDTMKTTKEHITEEFRNLEKLKAQNGFKTPEGYFNSLHDSIMNEVGEQPKLRKLSYKKVYKYAASVLLIAGISSYFFFSGNGQTTHDEFGNLTVTEYLESLEEIDLELDESLEFDEMAMN